MHPVDIPQGINRFYEPALKAPITMLGAKTQRYFNEFRVFILILCQNPVFLLEQN